MQTEISPQVSKLWFLTSTRFYAAIVACVQLAFGSDGVVTNPEIFQSVLALSGLFIVLKTAHNEESLNAYIKTSQLEQK